MTTGKYDPYADLVASGGLVEAQRQRYYGHFYDLSQGNRDLDVTPIIAADFEEAERIAKEMCVGRSLKFIKVDPRPESIVCSDAVRAICPSPKCGLKCQFDVARIVAQAAE